jgi:hypothetical protein
VGASDGYGKRARSGRAVVVLQSITHQFSPPRLIERMRRMVERAERTARYRAHELRRRGARLRDGAHRVTKAHAAARKRRPSTSVRFFIWAGVLVV